MLLVAAHLCPNFVKGEESESKTGLCAPLFHLQRSMSLSSCPHGALWEACAVNCADKFDYQQHVRLVFV